MTNRAKFLVAFALVACSTIELRSQAIFATLTGVVSDPSQAVVPQATVKLKNEQSGSLRETTTNSDGYYTFASLSVDMPRVRKKYTPTCPVNGY